MGDERHAIERLDDPRGVRPRGVEVAVVAHALARCPAAARALRIERGAGLVGERALRPFHLERAPALDRGPGVVGDHRDAGGEVRRERLAGLRAGQHDTSRTPGIFLAAVSSNESSSPSKYGQRAITASSAPGIVRIDAVARAAR